jgi:hypothetical protein
MSKWVRGQKIKGEDGYTPIKGIDYFDGKKPTDIEIENLIKPLIPKPIPGKDGSPDTPFQVRDKLESLEGQERLQITAVNGLEDYFETIEDIEKDIKKLKKNKGGVLAVSTGGGSSGLDTTAGDLRYLKLDASNDPLTGTLGFSSALNAGTILTVPDSDGSTYSDYTFHLGGGDNATGAGFNTFSFEMTANTTGSSNFRNLLYFGIVDQVAFENVGGYTFAFERFTSPGEGWSFNADARMAFSAVTDISFRMTDGAGSGAAGQFTFNDNAASGGAGEMRFLTAAAHRLIQTSVTQFTNTGAIAFGGGLALTINDSGKIQIRPPAMTIVGGTSFGTVNIQQAGTRTVPSSTTAFVGDLTIVPGTTSVSSGATLTTLAGLYISGAPTKSGTGTLTNGPYSVHIDAGTSRFDGDVQMLGDNVSTIYGAGLDASIYYDGTDLKINPKLVGTGVLDILGDLSLTAQNIITDTTTGTQIATATTQKIGFFGATPIVQQTTTSQTASTFVANTSGIVDDTATWDGYTVGDVVKILRVFGLLA